MLLFSVPWHPNLSYIPPSFTRKGFNSASSEMSGGDAPLKMCEGDLLLKKGLLKNTWSSGRAGRSSFVSFSLFFLTHRNLVWSFDDFGGILPEKQKRHIKPQKQMIPPFSEIRSWCGKNLKAATYGQARGGSGVSPEPRSSGKFMVTGVGQESPFMCHLVLSWNVRSPSEQSPPLPSPAWLCVATSSDKQLWKLLLCCSDARLCI